MGVDFGAMIFYGLPMVDNGESDVYDEDGEFDDDLDVWYNENPVTIVQTERYYDNERYVCVTETFYSASNGETKEVQFNIQDMVEWHKLLYDFCVLHDLEYQEPKWYLCSTIG